MPHSFGEEGSRQHPPEWKMGVHCARRPVRAWHLPAAAALLYCIYILHLANTGAIKLPLPYPAVNQFVHLYPTDVFPWHPRPFEGAFTHNTRLQAKRMFEGIVDGSESVIVSPDGVATMLDKYGGVYEATEGPDGTYALTSTKARAWLGPGRPLGAGFNAQGDLYVCDALKGLLLLPKNSSQVEVVSNRVSLSSPLEPGSPIVYANDLDIDSTGMIYFTTSVDTPLHRNAAHDSSFTHVPSLEGRAGFWDTVKGWGVGMCQGLPRGKVYRYNPATRATHLLLTGLFYSNGVAVSADDSYLVISETDRLRLIKYWLKGPKAGEAEVIISHLPGTPDGVTRAPDGNYWAALLVSPPKATQTFHLPIIRAILPRLSETVRPQVPDWGAVVKVSPEGEVLEWLEDPIRPAGQGKPSAYKISSAHERNGKLWLGGLSSPFVSYIDLKSLPPKPAAVPESWSPPGQCVTPPCRYVTHFH